MTILVEKSTKKSIFSRSFVILDSQMEIFFDEKKCHFSPKIVKKRIKKELRRYLSFLKYLC